jgi:hypothetical protein
VEHVRAVYFGLAKVAPQTRAVWGARPPCRPAQSRGVISNRLFLPCCWVKKSLALAFLNNFIPINPLIELSPSGHVQAGGFIIFIQCRQPVVA